MFRMPAMRILLIIILGKIAESGTQVNINRSQLKIQGLFVFAKAMQTSWLYYN
jgi:hypothetical protein